MRRKLAVILAVLIMDSSMPMHADMILAENLSDSDANVAIGDITEEIESAEDDKAPDTVEIVESEGTTDISEPQKTEVPSDMGGLEENGKSRRTETPAETEEPIGTEIPAEAEEPTGTETSTETKKPEGTEEPTETEAPAETEEPAGTEKPTETETPAETKEPTETEAPVETEKPTGTGTPVETEEPTNTEAPIEAEEPIQTDKPTDTKESMESPEKAPPIDAESVEGAERGISDITEGEAALSPEELNCIYNVSFPANTTAYFDPDNLSGKGQVFSNPYTVENYGNTDVAIKIKNIDIEYNSTETIYKFGEEEAEDSLSNVKRLHINMVWVNESENTEKVLKIMEGAPEEEVLVLRAAEYDEQGEFVSLREGGTGVFYFTGTVEASSGAVWEDGEITVRFDYEIVNAESVEKDIIASDMIHDTDNLKNGLDSDTEENQNKDFNAPEEKTDTGANGTEDMLPPGDSAIESEESPEPLQKEDKDETQKELPSGGDAEVGYMNG